MNSITELLVSLHGGRLDTLLLEIERDRYRMFRVMKHSVAEDIMSSSNNNTKGGASSTEVRGGGGCVKYNDATVFSHYWLDAERDGLVQPLQQVCRSSLSSAACIPYDHVSDVNIGKLPHKRLDSLHSKRKVSDAAVDEEGSVSRSDKYSSIDHYTFPSCVECTSGGEADNSTNSTASEVCVSSALPWSITGIAMVAHCIARCLLHSSAVAGGGVAAHITPPLSSGSVAGAYSVAGGMTAPVSNMPLVYSHAYVRDMAAKYAHALIRHSAMATSEGLEFINLLMSVTDDAPPRRCKLFSPANCPLQSESEGVRRLMEAFYSQAVDDGQSSSAVILSADSTDTISLLQSVITALVRIFNKSSQ